ncbi:MAG: hypothetical protein WBF13_00770 [Candidatus Zixiibacteriota bacterium]
MSRYRSFVWIGLVLVIIAGIACPAGAAKYPTGLLGKWKPVYKRYQQGDDPRKIGRMQRRVHFDLIEIYKSGDRYICVRGYRGRQTQNLGCLAYRREGGCPEKAWARDVSLLWPWRGDYEFVYDEDYDMMTVDFSLHVFGGEEYLEFERIADGEPCDERELQERRGREEYERSRERERRSTDSDQPPESRSTESGYEQTPKDEYGECIPKITSIQIGSSRGAFTYTFDLVIRGKCFPMNFQLWVDGEKHYYKVYYRGEDRLETVIFARPENRRHHYFQIRDLDTGRKSNVFKLYY